MKTVRLKPKKKKSDIETKRKYWKRLHDIIGFTPPLDGIICAASGNIHIDLFKLEKRISGYNSDKCEYKGKSNYSMSMAVKEEWGKEAVQLIKKLL